MTRTATVGLERGGPRDLFHAIAAQSIRIGYVSCATGEALCGTTATLLPCPDGLFAPQVTRHTCAVIAAREGITVGGTASSPQPEGATRRTS